MQARALTPIGAAASLLVLVVLVVLAWTGPARADNASTIVDPYELPDAPRSLSLPELTHPGIEWTSTTAMGQVISSGHSTPEILERLAVEAPIGPRRWYVGLAYESGYGYSVAAPFQSGFVSGNVELYGRTVWATRTGLSFGSGLGILPPIAAGNDAVALAAISLQPWDYAYFRVGVLTIRPFVDVRDLFGRFVVQFRQSFDFSVDVTGGFSTDASATGTLYFGWAAAPMVGVGLEATEYYLISADVPDNQRAKVMLAPNVRFLTRTVQPAIGAFVDLGTPISSQGETVWGLRFALTFVWDPRHADHTPLKPHPPNVGVGAL